MKHVADAAKYNPKIIGGDFKAWAFDWCYNSTNATVRIFVEALT